MSTLDQIAQNAKTILPAGIAAKVIAALTDGDERVEVIVYHAGWVPNSYPRAKYGEATVYRVTPDDALEVTAEYNMRRSNAQGPAHTITIARAGQKRGRYVH